MSNKMKKKYMFIIWVLLMVHTLSPKLYSSDPPPPCWMDCPNSIWVLENIQIRLGDICSYLPFDCLNQYLTISFWHRHAECPNPNPPWNGIDNYDCQIQYMNFNEVCNTMCLSQLDIFDMYNIALKKVYEWMVDYYGINPNEPAIWRAVNVSCWGRLTDGGQDWIEYCLNYSENCCWKKYSVIEVNGVNVFTLIEAYIPEGAPPNCMLDTKPCYYSCDMVNLEEGPPEKRAIFEGGIDLVNVEYENLFERMNQKYDGHVLNIFDINGRLIYSVKISKETNPVSYIDLLKGIYFYRVIDESNLNVENGKFIKN